MAKRPGPLTVGAQGKTYEETRLHSKFVPVESTRWTGINRGAYSNPRADAILDRLTATVAAGDRVQLHRELLQEQMGDLAVMPLWWNMVPTLTVKGVRGVRLVPTAATLSSFDWDRD